MLKPMYLRIGLIIAALVAAIVILTPHSSASSTTSMYSLPFVMQSVSAKATLASGTTALSVQFPVAPQTGDTIVCTEADAYNGPNAGPSNYTQFANPGTSSGDVGITGYYHIVASTDTNTSLQFAVNSATNWFVDCDDWHGTNATVPIATSNLSTATSLSSTLLSFPGITPNEPGDVGVEVLVHNVTTMSASDPSFTHQDWVVSESGFSGEELDTSTAWNPFTSSIVGSANFLYSGDNVGLIYLMRPLVGNYNLGGRVAMAATATPAPNSTPTPSSSSSPGSGGIPALGPWETYWGNPGDAMANISPGNVTKWADYCQGNPKITAALTGGDSGGAYIFSCPHPYEYTSVNMFQPATSGNVATFPFNGNFTGTNCPAPYKAANFALTTGTDAPDWTSSDNTKNWFVYEGTIGSDADRVGAYYSNARYAIFTNLFSTELAQSLQDAFNNCSYYSQPLSQYEGWWNDNGYMGLTSASWVIWWGEGTYNQKINWGSVNGTPYVSFTCGGGPENGNTSFWNGGTYCGTSSQINSTPLTAGNSTYGPDVGTGTNMISTPIQGWQTLMSRVKKPNGQLYDWQFNDLVNGYAACDVLNAEPNVTGGIKEGATNRGWGDGRLQADLTVAGVIDDASNVYACGGHGAFFVHDYINEGDAKYYNSGVLTTVANGGVVGTPQQQMDVRAHIYIIWLLWNDKYPQMMGSFTHACSQSGSCGTSYPSWTDVWSFDFAVPSGRITPYPANALSSNGQYCNTEPDYHNMGTNQPCAQGGAHDTHICVTGTVPNCVFIASYSHFYVWNYTVCGTPDQTKWNGNSGCVEDIGPFTVLYNLTGATQTLSSANLSSWIGSTQYNSLHYMLWPGCIPTSAAYGTSAGSTVYPGDGGGQPATSAPSTSIVCTKAGDVYNGGRMGFVPLSSILGTTLPDGESIGFTAKQQ